MSTERLPGVGSTIGSYRLDAVLGRGGMGVVYRAEDLRLGRKVALKLLRGSLAGDAEYRDRFLRESRLAASIEHAAILPVYDAGETDGLLYIAMRFVDGVDLAQLLRREGPLAPERAVALVGQIAGALDAAHARGLIHRDVKPSNALIATDGDGEHAYLVDFGITQDTAAQERLTATGQLVGTLDYLAPERLRGEPVDGRADIYALGCVLFECLTGEVPFTRANEAAAIYAHLEEQPPRPSELRPGLPKALDAIVARALAKDRADRWQTGAELRAAAQRAIAPGAPARAGMPLRGRIAAAALALLAIAGAAGLVLGGDDRMRLAALDGDAVGLIDPETGDISAPQYRVGRDPGALAVGDGSVWASSTRDETVSRIDSGQIVKIAVPDDPAGMAFASGSLWVANHEGRTVSRIDPTTNKVMQSIPVGNGPRAVAAGFGALWVASDVDRKVFRVDLAQGTTTDVDLATNASAVATGADAVWVASEESGSVYRIEPAARAVSKTIPVGNGPAAIVATDRAVWVANRQDGTVSRIDPATNSITAIPVGREPASLAVGAGGVWVGNGGDGSVMRVDPAKRRVVQTVEVGASPTALAIADGSVWTATRPSTAGHRGGTLRVNTFRDLVPPKLEPAGYDSTDTIELLSLAHEGLVAYRRTDSSTYGRLVGALATQVPEPSPDGRTYVFKLRTGLRYSDGTPVRPQDFRASLADFLKRFGKDRPAFYASIVGAPECAKRPARCDLSEGIATDEAAGTITLRLSEPDSELLDKLAFPFAWVAPADHPFRPRTPTPSTGPYRTVSLNRRDGARFVRNPHFRPRPSEGRPDGLPDEIRVTFNKHFDRAVAAVERGAADVMVVSNRFGAGDGWSPARIAALTARTPGRLHTDAASETEFMWLNVHKPPFDDPRVRQALNYAVDRREVERRAGGSNLAQLTCGLVPPGFPGYKPACRYTADAGPSGHWSAPDLPRARGLIAQSGTKGQRITVWGWAEKRAVLAYFAEVLDRLGYRASLKVFPRVLDYGAEVWGARAPVQIGILGVASDVAAASNFAGEFRCASFNASRFCDRRIEARAEEAQTARSAEADAIWQDLYRRLDAAAPYVALVNRRTLTLVSGRVGNYQHHPLFGPLYDQMWVR